MQPRVRVERTRPSCAGRRPPAMKVVLTGATGFVGSHVLADLYKHGHEVTALVRDDAQADTVAARGATPVVVDLYDRPAVTRLLGDADGAIHTASPGDATSADRLVMPGTAQQHWSTVHAADLADSFRRALENESARGRYVIGNGVHPTVAELTQAAAVAADAPGAVPGSGDEARARLGDYFAEVLLLDQGTDAARARTELGWYPSHPSLSDEFRHGSYRK